MRYVLLAFELELPMEEYPELADEIEQLGKTMYVFGGTRVVRTKLTLQQVLDELQIHVRPKDRILAAQVDAWITYPTDYDLLRELAQEFASFLQR